MTSHRRFKMKPYIQPFEESLAIDELRSLTCGAVVIDESNPDVKYATTDSEIATQNLINKLAYWEAVEETEPRLTSQVIREATYSISRNGVELELLPQLEKSVVAAKAPRRRTLRYGPHGIHEYRGKFFPQLVKSLINISGISPNSLIADPMCGSGTTAVEACLAGHSASGTDMNPLSVFMSRVKCDLLTCSPSDLISAFQSVEASLSRNQLERPSREPKDQEYLNAWFAENVLVELDQISGAIDTVDCAPAQGLFRVALSNILRSVSYQKEADLRVRREVKEITSGQAITAFRDEALKSTKALVAFLAHGELGSIGDHRIQTGDARSFAHSNGLSAGSVDLVITSPPYATALPYLDTDRLSLIYLNLLPRADHRSKDKEMIGNREVTEKGRQELWKNYVSKRDDLTVEINELIDRIDTENASGEVGFRRKNLPALLGKYFSDMREVLTETHFALKPGGTAFFVVGNNRTTTPKGEVEIETAQLLAELGKQAGFNSSELIPMDMLTSRDIFSKNQTPSEHIIRFSR